MGKSNSNKLGNLAGKKTKAGKFDLIKEIKKLNCAINVAEDTFDQVTQF